MLHHQVVDLLGALIPPFLFIMGVVVFPLPFSCFDKVGQAGQIGGQINGRCFELKNGKSCKQAVELQAVCDMLEVDLNVEIECGCHLGSPRVFKNDMFEALRGHCK